ncbi:mechanosensitive ion channel family protein [Anaerolineales bacterium HSG24]|nr:mechanosensitive ion channel family protein [Anaerolineales bacterium HSG24]
MSNIDSLYRAIIIIIGELIMITGLFTSIYLLIKVSVKQLKALSFLHSYRTQLESIQHNIKGVLLLLFSGLVLSILTFNGYLVYNQIDLWYYMTEQLATIPPNYWFWLGIGVSQAFVLVVIAHISTRRLTATLPNIQAKTKSIEQIKANDESVDKFFGILNSIQITAIWLIVITISTRLLPFLNMISDGLYTLLKVYLIISAGRLAIILVRVIVDSLEDLVKKYTLSSTVQDSYQRLYGLLPLLNRAVEYVIYIGTATLSIQQVDFTAEFALYGNIIIRIIGIIFFSRLIVELFNLLIDKFLLVRDNLTDIQWQQRLTMVPLVKSTIKYVIYFSAILLLLSALHFNVAPILAAIGGVGLVVGIGAQPVVNDLVSGLFVLFENLYLVGDYIELGEAKGVVEGIDIRTTRLRDPDGQLHIVRNGQIGNIVSYSKGYTLTIVRVGVAYDSDLERVYEVITEVGKQFNQMSEQVLAPTEVEGIEDFGGSEIVIRTATKVKPGFHREVGYEFRKQLKQAFDEAGIEIPFSQHVIHFKDKGMSPK